MRVLLWLGFSVLACGGSASPSPVPPAPAPTPPPLANAPPAPEATTIASSSEPTDVASSPAPSASAETPEPAPKMVFAPLTASWQCNAKTKIPTKPFGRPSSAGQPVSAGQMTEQAAQAKRLFDSEKWADASRELDRVARGDTGDDTGNKMIADYLNAIALYRLDRSKDAAKKFRSIAGTLSHLKHRETALWLVKIAEQHPELVQPSDFSTYTHEDLRAFDNPQQKDVYAASAFLAGRERVAAGRIDEARELLQSVSSDHAYAAAAKTCLDLLASRGK